MISKHSIKRLFIPMNMLTFRPHQKSDGNESPIISAANSYEIAYAVNQYLFKADTELGQIFVQSIYKALPKDAKYLFVAYTNIFHPNHVGRMLQDIWVFKTRKEVDENLNDMRNSIKNIPFSHLKQLPIVVNFKMSYWINDFEDLNYFSDKFEIAKVKIQEQKLTQEQKNKHTLIVHKISPYFIKKAFSNPRTIHLGTKAVEYNERIETYLTNRQNNKYTKEEALTLAKSFHHEYTNFYYHLDLPSAPVK